MPGSVDSNNPIVRDLVDGQSRLFVMTSWGGTPSLSMGSDLDHLPAAVPVVFDPHPGHGVWMESVVVADDGTWYGYYHNEWPAADCGRDDRFIPRLGAARSTDRGRTWHPLGVILQTPLDSHACASSNRFVLGGVGDVSVMLDARGQDLYFFFSQYVRDPDAQGIGVARLAWADRDAPAGRLSIWQRGAWIPPRSDERSDVSDEAVWDYPVGSALVPPSQPWHDGHAAADVYWGPSVHWNTYLEQYVMLMNRARDESFNADGIYVAFAPSLDDPGAWSAPKKIMNGGQWYAQVAGLEPDGTDKRAGQRARFFNLGRSDYFIEFVR
jgi:hypothetical protein